MLTTENCGNCEIAEQEMMQVAQHFKTNKHVIIGKVDAKLNDLVSVN
jgi:hypothetical protein